MRTLCVLYTIKYFLSIIYDVYTAPYSNHNTVLKPGDSFNVRAFIISKTIRIFENIVLPTSF